MSFKLALIYLNQAVVLSQEVKQLAIKSTGLANISKVYAKSILKKAK